MDVYPLVYSLFDCYIEHGECGEIHYATCYNWSHQNFEEEEYAHFEGNKQELCALESECGEPRDYKQVVLLRVMKYIQ